MEMKELFTGVKAMCTEETENRKKPKKPLILVSAAVIVVVLVAILAGGRKTVDMEDYVQVNFSGLNEKGRAELAVDYSGLAQELPEQKNSGQQDTISAAFGNLAGGIMNRALIEGAVQCELDRTSGLSNGDKVTVSVKVNDDQCKELGVKIKEKDITFSVEGLKEVEPVDAFADVTVVFDGISPNATAKVVNNSRDEACMSYSYSLDRNSGLSIGDTVTVSISEDNIDMVAEQTGKAPAENEKQFTVDGVSYYVTELSQIPEAALSNMQKEATDSLTAHVARNWVEEDQLEGMEYLGGYLLTKKPTSSARNQNMLYLVYEVSHVNSHDGVEEHMKYYYYMVFTNVSVDADGKSVVWKDYDTVSNRYSFEVNGRSLYVYGYETLAELFKDCVTARVDAYTYESSVEQSTQN